MKSLRYLLTALSLACCLMTVSLQAQPEDKTATDEKSQPVELKLGDGVLNLMVPGDWTKEQPRTNIVEAEFSLKAVEGDDENGRLTMMASGGGAEANIERWKGQFTQPDGAKAEDAAKVEEKTIDDMKVHVVDISGNFMDAPRGPFGPKVERKGYRMLAAIVETGKGDYFLKLYGPKKTIDANADQFGEMIKSLKGAKKE
jgi:hypothetical protein